MLARLSSRHVVLALALMITASRSVAGQSPRPQPRLHHLQPAGGQAGQTVEVVVSGTELGALDGLWFSGPGIETTPIKGKSGAVHVKIAASTLPGVFDTRALTPDGVSNPRTFVIGDKPETTENEPNNASASANPVRVNSVVNGTITASDVDVFAFEGKKEQRVFMDLAAERIESKLDATLRLFDSRGVELAESRDATGADPFLDVRLPRDGTYFVKVHDVTFAGSPDHFYRLTLHDGPHLDGVEPAIAAAGRPGAFSMIGRNLGGRILPERIDGRPIEAKPLALTPEFHPTSELPTLSLGSTTAMRGHVVRFASEQGTSNPVLIVEAGGPVVEEREPNGIASPQDVTPPCSVAGVFTSSSDTDVYRFAARKGETWRIEVVAEGIDSPADPALVVQRIVEKGEPVEVAGADDTPDPGLSPRLNLASVDATLRWQVPADSTYQVVVNDLAGSSRRGARPAYRFTIRRERPDFQLFLLPPTPNVLDSVTLRRGGRASATVVAWRQEGFSGPIWVAPRDLPDGVRCEPVVISAGQAAATVVFEANAKTGPSVGVVHLVGVGSTIDSPRWLTPPTPETWPGFDRSHDAIALGTIWPLLKGNGNSRTTVAPIRATRGFVVAIRDGSAFLLSARSRRSVVVQGQSIDLDVTADRATGFDEAIVLSASDLPTGLPPLSGSVPKSESHGKLSWTVPKNFAPGVYSLVVRGTATYQPDPKTPAKFKVDEPSNPLVVSVRAAPIELSLETKPGSLKRGETTKAGVKIVRVGKFVGPVVLGVEFPPPASLEADPLTLDAGQTAGTLSIRATGHGPAIDNVAGRLRAEAVVDGETLEVATPISITVTKP